MYAKGFQRLIEANECVAEELSRQGTQGYKQGKRLMSCSHEPGNISHCNSPLCFKCRNWKHENESKLLQMQLRSFQRTNPRVKLRFGTFTARDTPPSKIRGVAKRLSCCWYSVASSVPGLIGSFRVTEIKASPINAEMENPHIHALIALSPGHFGRNYWTKSAWREWWRNKMGTLARDTVDCGVEVEPLRYGIEEAANYLLPWGDESDKNLDYAAYAINNPSRYIERVEQLKNLPQHKYSGFMGQEPIPNPADDPTGFTLPMSQKQWQTYQHTVARASHPCSKKPLIPIAES